MMIDRRHILSLIGSVGIVATTPGLARAAPVTLDDIKKRGTVQIGCEATYPPFSFRDKGVIVGYDVDLAELLFAPIGVKPQFIDTEWAGVIPSLYADRFDLIMSSLSYTRERMEKVAFTIPYAEASQALLIRTADAGTIKSIDDMSGKILGIKLGSPGQVMEPSLDAKVKGDRGQGFSSVKTYDDHPAAYLALGQATVDGVLNTLPTLADMVKTTAGKFTIVRGVGKQNWAGIAARKDEPELVAYVNTQLLAREKDGSLAKLQEKWFGLHFDLPDAIPAL